MYYYEKKYFVKNRVKRCDIGYFYKCLHGHTLKGIDEILCNILQNWWKLLISCIDLSNGILKMDSVYSHTILLTITHTCNLQKCM